MRTTILVAAAVLCLADETRAQPKPDFSGTWVATKDAPPAVQLAPSPTFGVERFALKHTGENLTVIRPVRDTAIVGTYTLDGRETQTRIPGGLCLADSGMTETAVREGDALVLSLVASHAPGGGATMKRDIKRTLRLTSPDTLVVETRMAVKGELVPVATVYKRSTESLAEPSTATGKVPATIAQAAWIGTTWSGTVKTTTVEERWTPPSGGAMLAVARTMRDGIMSSFEFLCIVERGGTLVYSAMPNGRSPATHFTLTSISDDAATFENPAHDYPKVVRYSKLADGSLETMISGEGGQRAVKFVLKKQ